ncbi:hypothetical protein PHYBOEH_003475 [Phytophthora boehmeriae]|uniref:Uncharacterized protein n=1 Tax=Phytophthora boehmeriae TaxID=109152 RepID=A0A8T1X8N8_9STRA|nr:hypothetical protein PHYBOEH_003475 [Phytophthora boehmeriae]
MLQSLPRRFISWQLAVAKGDRTAIVRGGFVCSALVLVLILWVFTSLQRPVTSVLLPSTPFQAAVNANVDYSTTTTTDDGVSTTVEIFPQYGDKSSPGMHFRLENSKLLMQAGNREEDSVLLVVVLKDAESWGEGRTVDDFFKLVDSFDYPEGKISIALLTSCMQEFSRIKELYRRYIQRYPRMSVIFRDDFSSSDGVLTRDNRHSDELQKNRRRVIARYRNYAVLSAMETWHQHVFWVDADVHKIPADLMKKMIHSGLDIVEPMCVRMREDGKDWYEYDLNAWVGRRKERGSLRDSNAFVPGDLKVERMWHFHGKEETFVPLDSVGGTMLYVKADVHRQGVLFPVHYLIGSEWAKEGYDGIETEGLCYVAHFLGFKCWGMPNDLIYHI